VRKKKVISFSLYGDSPKYVAGALANVQLARALYPEWVARIYLATETSQAFPGLAAKLETFGAEVHPGFRDIPPMFWRFIVADDKEVSRFIVRDTDSRITVREVEAVDAWIAEDKILHTMRDHPAHARAINGGMWGAVWRRPDWEAPAMLRLIEDYKRDHWNNYKGHDHDQDFLCKMIWPWAVNSATQHDAVCRQAYPGSKRFPVRRSHDSTPWPRFVGEVFEVDNFNLESWTWTEKPRERDWESIPIGE
jgi:hypothetical protein